MAEIKCLSRAESYEAVANFFLEAPYGVRTYTELRRFMRRRDLDFGPKRDIADVLDAEIPFGNIVLDPKRRLVFCGGFFVKLNLDEDGRQKGRAQQ